MIDLEYHSVCSNSTVELIIDLITAHPEVQRFFYSQVSC